jgi:hypothetical protein
VPWNRFKEPLTLFCFSLLNSPPSFFVHFLGLISGRGGVCGKGESDGGRKRDKTVTARVGSDAPRAGSFKKSGGVLCQGRAMKYEYIASHQKEYGVGLACRTLEVSVSGYYAWRKRQPSLAWQLRPGTGAVAGCRSHAGGLVLRRRWRRDPRSRQGFSQTLAQIRSRIDHLHH